MKEHTIEKAYSLLSRYRKETINNVIAGLLYLEIRDIKSSIKDLTENGTVESEQPHTEQSRISVSGCASLFADESEVVDLYKRLDEKGQDIFVRYLRYITREGDAENIDRTSLKPFILSISKRYSSEWTDEEKAKMRAVYAVLTEAAPHRCQLETRLPEILKKAWEDFKVDELQTMQTKNAYT